MKRTYHPHRTRRQRTHGFRKRMETRQGREVINRAIAVLDSLPEPETTADELPVYQLGEDPLAFTVARVGHDEFRVSGKRIERAVAMTYWDYDQAVNRFQRILATMGITAALEEAGVKTGDTVYIGEFELEWGE